MRRGGEYSFASYPEFFAGFEDVDLEALALHAVRLSFHKGDHIIEEGQPADRFYILISGTLELSFLAPVEPGEMDPHVEDAPDSVVIHAINKPGPMIGWSAMVEPHRYRATVSALEATRLLVFERRFVEDYCERWPEFGLRFMRRILRVLGDRIGSSRAQLVSRRDSREAARVRDLLVERGSRLGVNSALYKIAIYLENRLTAADAYDVLDELALSSDPVERDLAVPCRQLIAGAEREARVFCQLQRIYDAVAVAQAPDSSGPAEIRRKCCEGFRELYALTDYRIQGWENFPSEAGFIVLVNHLSNHPSASFARRPRTRRVTGATLTGWAISPSQRVDRPGRPGKWRDRSNEAGSSS